jgi:hypothetical protein
LTERLMQVDTFDGRSRTSAAVEEWAGASGEAARTG